MRALIERWRLRLRDWLCAPSAAELERRAKLDAQFAALLAYSRTPKLDPPTAAELIARLRDQGLG